MSSWINWVSVRGSTSLVYLQLYNLLSPETVAHLSGWARLKGIGIRSWRKVFLDKTLVRFRFIMAEYFLNTWKKDFVVVVVVAWCLCTCWAAVVGCSLVQCSAYQRRIPNLSKEQTSRVLNLYCPYVSMWFHSQAVPSLAPLRTSHSHSKGLSGFSDCSIFWF